MKKLFLLFVFVLLVPFFVIHPVYASQPNTFKVLKVVDGDTIVVDVRGKKETVRLLGIDTPETVDPRKPVQCFGKNASDKMKYFVQGKSILLVDEQATQGNRDKYNRLLRYVYLPDSVRTFVNGEMVKQGYAFSFRQYPTKMLNKFNAWEAYAREYNFGLWGSCSLPVSPTVGKKTTMEKNYVQPKTSRVNNFNTSTTTTSSLRGDKDCKDFATHAAAQAYFTSKGGSPTNNVDKLDNDHDGIVCESLP